MKSTPVVTGMGIICSIGHDKRTFWNALRNGVCGVGVLDLFDPAGYRSSIACQVKDVNIPDSKNLSDFHHLGRCDLLGLWAAREAISEARILERKLPPSRVAVVLGAGAGGVFEAEQFRRQLHLGLAEPRPSLLMSYPICNVTDLIGNLYGFSGMRSTVATACSSSATAIGYAAELVRRGKADVVITGGSESLSELTFAGFNSLRSVDRVTCRPFDRNREGLVLGEGAGILVIESHEQAKANGISSYCEVAGFGISADAHHITSPDPYGEGAVRSMAAAIFNSDASADSVDYINAHGTGTPVNDKVETLAIKKLFGNRAYEMPISSTKSAHGHCLGAAGAIEAAATILSIHHGILPPTLNLLEMDADCDLDYVPIFARPAEIRFALSNSFAFGGNNTTLGFRRIADPNNGDGE